MDKEWVTLIVAVLGSAGLLGSWAAFRKSKPEAGKIFIDAAQGVVLMQTGVIEDLRKEVRFLREENAKVSKENSDLKQRLEELEDKVRELTKRTTSVEKQQDTSY